MTDPGWVVTPKESLPALAEDFEAERYAGSEPLRSRTDWVSIQEKIGAAKMEELLAIFGGYPIDPSTP